MFPNRFNVTRAFKKKLQQMDKKKLKFLAIAITAGISVGCVFGFLSLQMAEKDNLEINASAPVRDDAIQNEEDKKESHQLDGLFFYVIQAGVYTDIENAERERESFTSKGYASMVWQRSDQVFLFTNIGATKDAIKKRSVALKDDDFDIFTKEWDIQGKTVDITIQEVEFVQGFIESFRQALKEQTLEPLKQLEKTSTNINGTIKPLQEKLTALLQTEEMEQQIILLELANTYEKILEK